MTPEQKREWVEAAKGPFEVEPGKYPDGLEFGDWIFEQVVEAVTPLIRKAVLEEAAERIYYAVDAMEPPDGWSDAEKSKWENGTLDAVNVAEATIRDMIDKEAD